MPALDGVVDRLRAGIRVADVGCGHGAATILLGRAFPNSTFVGFDYHDASIARLTELLDQSGFSRVRLATTTPINLVIEAKP